MVARFVICSALVALGILFGSLVHAQERAREGIGAYSQPNANPRTKWYEEIQREQPYTIEVAVGHVGNQRSLLNPVAVDEETRRAEMLMFLAQSESLTIRTALDQGGMVSTKSGVRIYYRLLQGDAAPRLEMRVEEADGPVNPHARPELTMRRVDTAFEPTLSEWIEAARLQRDMIIKATGQRVSVSWKIAVRVERNAGEND